MSHDGTGRGGDGVGPGSGCSRSGEDDGSRTAGDAGGEGTITCQEAVDRVYEFLDGELGPEWTDRVRRHIEVCKRCYPYFNFERIFLDHIRSRGLGERRSRELEERVSRLLQEIED